MGTTNQSVAAVTSSTLPPMTASSSLQDVSQEELSLLLTKVSEDRDTRAFNQLFKYFAPKIKMFGAQRLGQQGLALDLLQETMASVWSKAHLFNAEKGAVNTWIFTIMRNQCFDMLRRVQHNKEDSYGDEIWPIFDTLETEDPLPDPQLSRRLKEQMEDLPYNQRLIVQGVYLYEYSQQELADQLNIPIGTVKSRLRLGLEKLKHALDSYEDAETSH